MDPEIEAAFTSYTPAQRATLEQVRQSVELLKDQKASLDKEANEVEAKVLSTRQETEALETVRESLQRQCQEILGIELCFAEAIRLSPVGAREDDSDIKAQGVLHSDELLTFKDAAQRLQDAHLRARSEHTAISMRLKRARRALASAEEELRNTHAAVDELRRRLSEAGFKDVGPVRGGKPQAPESVNPSQGDALDKLRAEFRQCDPAGSGAVKRAALAHVLRSIGTAGYWTDARVDKLLDAAGFGGCAKDGANKGVVEYDKFLRWMFAN